MPYRPGQSGNPRGRPVGSRKRPTALVLRIMKERNDTDPLALLSTIVTTAEAPLELRVQAAGMLAPYTHSRCTARYIRKKIDLPVVETERRLIANAGGELTPIAASHPEDKEQLAASDQGELPNELLQKVPVEPGNYPLGLDDARRRAAGTRPIKRAPMNYSQVAISLNEA
jgi:hypothetical protein